MLGRACVVPAFANISCLIQREACVCVHVSVCLLTCQSSVVLSVWIAAVHSAVSQTALLCFAHVYRRCFSDLGASVLGNIFGHRRNVILFGSTNNAPFNAWEC